MDNRQTDQNRSRRSLKIIAVFFEVAWYLTWVAVALSIALLVVVNVTDFRVKYIHLPMQVDYRNTEITPDFGSERPSSDLVVKGFSDLIVDASEAPMQGYFLWIPALLSLGLLWIVQQVRQFLRSVRKGTPFIPENARILRRIGYVVTLGGPIIGILTFIYGMAYQSMVDFPGADVTVPMNVYPFVMFLGLVILVIAQVFDYGVKLQAEQDLTV